MQMFVKMIKTCLLSVNHGLHVKDYVVSVDNIYKDKWNVDGHFGWCEPENETKGLIRLKLAMGVLEYFSYVYNYSDLEGTYVWHLSLSI